MRNLTRVLLCTLLSPVCTPLHALATTPETRIYGVVTDTSGKPIRGAMIGATRNKELTARFSQADGKYELKLPAGTYAVQVKAFGYLIRSVTASASKSGATNFQLTPGLRMDQLTGADVEQLLPVNPEVHLIAAECIRCHSMTHMARGGSMPAETWKKFLPRMTDGRHWDDPYSGGEFKGSGTPPVDQKQRLDVLGHSLEKYFGPDSPYFSPNAEPPKLIDFKHVPPSDLVLHSTMHEFDIPTKDVGAHSIMTDKDGNAWFSEIQAYGNKIGKFDRKSKTFTEYSLPIADSRPHTGAFCPNGILWMPLTAQTIHAKLLSLDPRNGEMHTYDFPGNPARPHAIACDQEGNIWTSGTGFLFFDTHTHQFKEIKLPIPSGTDYPDITWMQWHNLPGERLPVDKTIYDVKIDSKGMVWTSIETIGWLFRYNPKTGDIKSFVPPNTVSIKSIEIDSDDNVWFAEFWGSFIGKYDQKTDKFTEYTPPTPFAMIYGLTADKKNGYIWGTDLNGNHMTRLDPRTGQFDEVPFWTPQASARFPGWDPLTGRVWFTEALADKIGYVEFDPDYK
jgi:virginiamycin B lyase